ncbi:atrial natriuretic peptide receptor 3-like [Physella acuta]|uniref:atrial natriuretic peptide receptor 3-like n=1 Tax=Physella acuta TaxID=109671 RepID=UPI0027DBEE30|nr:atrial natriuretic peptide receptor 3-like [Physella acuta]
MGSTMLILWVTQFLVNSIAGTEPTDGQVTMVTLLPMNESYTFSMKRVLPAILIAAEKVCQPGGPLEGRRIEILHADTHCAANEAMNEAITFYINRRPHVLLGPSCEYALAPVARQARYWKLPVITTAAARDFSNLKGSAYKTLTLVWSTLIQLVQGLYTIMERYEWSTTKILYQPDGLENRYCHFAGEALHFELTALGKPTTYFKFEKIGEMLENMVPEIGNDKAKYIT